MQFRSNWGFEININGANSKDQDVRYNYYEATLSSWFNVNPKWSGNVWGGYSKTYNFSREYLAFYSWIGAEFSWKAIDIIQVGTSVNTWIEGNPDNNIEDITYNARPWISVTPVNDLNLYVYIDNLYLRSSKQMERIFLGALFSYQFSPKSWIYLALNEAHNRDNPVRTLNLTDRVSVFKIKYLYYF